MNATKILWGQILLVCAVVARLRLGARRNGPPGSSPSSRSSATPGSRLFGWPVYQPPAFFWWWFAYDAYAHEIFVTGGFIAGAGGVAAFVVAVAMSVWRAREVKKVTTYGSARWAEAREIRKAGLLHPDGVLLGRWRGAYLRHDGPEHVLCFAPTRSRQGRRPGRADAADLAGLGDRPRHQGRELGPDRRLARAVRPRAAVRSDQHAERRLQSAARGPPRRMGGARRPEHRRRAGRSRRRAGDDGTTGRRPAIRCWSARSCTCSTPRRTRRSPASPTSSPIRSARSRRRCAR